MPKKLSKLIEYTHSPYWLGAVLVLSFILHLPNFFEPYTYGDEMIYMALGDGIRNGLTLYSDIHDNKPPLLYFLAALSGNLFWFKAMLVIWSLITIGLFWKLTTLLFKKENSQKIATFIFALLTSLPLLEGNIANSENFMIGFSIIGLLIYLKAKKPQHIFFSGIFFSIGALFKIPAAFDILLIFSLIFVDLITKKQNLKTSFAKVFLFCIGFATPILITFAWYLYKGAFLDYIKAAYLQNVGYLSSFRPSDTDKNFFVKNAPLLTRAFICFLGVAITVFNSKKISRVFLISAIWTFFALFAVTLSERPYPHYLLQIVPPASLLVAILVTSQKIDQVLTIPVFFIIFFVPVYYKFYYYNSFFYYNRFLNFSSGKITKEEYFSSFDKNTNRNYEIANYLRQTTSPHEKVFIYGDSSGIYALSNRNSSIKYVADYHIRDFWDEENLVKSLNANPPRIIIILPNNDNYQNLMHFVSSKYSLIKQIDNAFVWKWIN